MAWGDTSNSWLSSLSCCSRSAQAALHPGARHEQAGGEVVGGLFGLGGGREARPVDVGQLAEAVVDDVLQRIAPPGSRATCPADGTADVRSMLPEPIK
jgi:hypothetical protein